MGHLPSESVRELKSLNRRLPILQTEERMPHSRGECIEQGLGDEIPCPFLSCKYHLALDVTSSGTLLYTTDAVSASEDGIPEIDLYAMAETCALRVADRGGQTLDSIAAYLGVVSECVRQVEQRALERLRDGLDT